MVVELTCNVTQQATVMMVESARCRRIAYLGVSSRSRFAVSLAQQDLHNPCEVQSFESTPSV